MKTPEEIADLIRDMDEVARPWKAVLAPALAAWRDECVEEAKDETITALTERNSAIAERDTAYESCRMMREALKMIANDSFTLSHPRTIAREALNEDDKKANEPDPRILEDNLTATWDTMSMPNGYTVIGVRA